MRWSHPDTVEELRTPAAIPRYAQLRYSADEDFVVCLAGDINRLGDREMYTLCRRLARAPEWGAGASARAMPGSMTAHVDLETRGTTRPGAGWARCTTSRR